MSKHPKTLSQARRRRTRGSSLVETLIAMAILALMMVGVLQMFSLSLLVNKGSEARTLMTFKAQQVVENIRMAYYLANQVPPQPAMGMDLGLFTSISPPYITATSTPVQIPSSSTAWGPTGANVVEPNGPFDVFYTITNGGGTPPQWNVTVTCLPTSDTSAARRFFGPTVAVKRVDYVAQIFSK